MSHIFIIRRYPQFHVRLVYLITSHNIKIQHAAFLYQDEKMESQEGEAPLISFHPFDIDMKTQGFILQMQETRRWWLDMARRSLGGARVESRGGSLVDSLVSLCVVAQGFDDDSLHGSFVMFLCYMLSAMWMHSVVALFFFSVV